MALIVKLTGLNGESYLIDPGSVMLVGDREGGSTLRFNGGGSVSVTQQAGDVARLFDIAEMLDPGLGKRSWGSAMTLEEADVKWEKRQRARDS